MSTSVVNQQIPSAQDVKVTDDTLSVDLRDGRTISVPIGMVPKARSRDTGRTKQLEIDWGREGIHWENLDEEISIGCLLDGHASGESQASFRKWLENRNSSRNR